MSAFAYYDTDTGSIVYHVLPGPDSPPSTIFSETDSTSSTATIEHLDLPGYFVMHHGRQHPASQTIVKWFPADNIRRYVIQYLLSNYVFGGDYVGPVEEILAPIHGRQKRVLELGTKAGTWIQSMATQFPHVRFRTVDVVPVIPHVPRHNVEFEIFNYTEGLLLEDESQDAVFLNIIIEMVRDYRALLREAYRVLRPGGLIYINDYSPTFWDPKDTTKVAWHTNPRGCQLHDLVKQFVSAMGIDPDTCDKLPQWLAPGSDLWDNDMKGFHGVETVTRMYPGYPHDGCECMDQVDPKMAPYFRNLAVTSMRDMCGLVKDIGLGDEEAESLIEDTVKELASHESCVLFKVYHVYGIKI